jgi:anti-sigma regulatory factor (Ser/Thr protein kinase)
MSGEAAAMKTTPKPWRLHSFLALGALPSAVPCARLHVKHVLCEWGLKDLTETVELIVSELVTNSIKATRAMPGPLLPPIQLILWSDLTKVVVEVWDGSPQPPVLAGANTAADGGRGLLLVDSLATRWNWYSPREWGGKVVWAEVLVR